jgi:hypothetical protein
VPPDQGRHQLLGIALLYSGWIQAIFTSAATLLGECRLMTKDKQNQKLNKTIPTGLDPDDYLLNNPDLRKTGEDPIVHWMTTGQKQDRKWNWHIVRVFGENGYNPFLTQSLNKELVMQKKMSANETFFLMKSASALALYQKREDLSTFLHMTVQAEQSLIVFFILDKAKETIYTFAADLRMLLESCRVDTFWQALSFGISGIFSSRALLGFGYAPNMKARLTE